MVGKGESDAKMYLAKLDDALNSGHEETYAEYKLRTSCPPHSPIIRSKYQRKIKAAENKASNYNGDSRTWQATPPKRLIRHRKISSEKETRYLQFNRRGLVGQCREDCSA